MASKDTSLTVGEKRKLVQHEDTIEKGLHSFVEVGRALIAIRDEKLYTDVGETFEKYCSKRWGFTRQRAYQIIDSSRVVDVVSTIVDIQQPANEAQARVLATLPDEQTQANVWVKAVETAPKGSDGAPKVTAAHVKKVADEMSPKMPSNGKAPAKPQEHAPEDKCPACAGTKWKHGEDGWTCAKCHHPHGEPAGDADSDRLSMQRSKTVKTCEALMRAFDDLNLLRPKKTEAIRLCKDLLAIAKDWK